MLTIGATGQLAGLVVPALAGRAREVRAVMHDLGKTGRLQDSGVAETVAGDLRESDSMRTALDGIDCISLILRAFAADATELGTTMVATAQAAGVQRVVFSGVYHPSLCLVNHADSRPIEEALYNSDLEFTVLQPAMSMQGLSSGWRSAVRNGAFAMPYSKDSAMTFVDYRDVADVVANAVASDELVNGTFEVASGGMVSRAELASLMSRHAERDVVAVDLEPETALQGMPEGHMREGLMSMFGAYTAHGLHGGNNLVLRSIPGRPPRTLDAFVAGLSQ